MNSKQHLANAFANPPDEYSLVPFWFWNGDLRYEELERQLHEMKAKNVTHFLIHARRGLLVPYLSQEWFDRVRFTIEKAAEMGMYAWIYDEDNWPSGYAGGRVIESQPDFRAKNLKLTTEEIHGPARVTLTVPDGELVTATLYDLSDGQIDVNNYRDVSSDVSEGQLSVDVGEGDWLVACCTQHYTDWWAAYSDDAYVDLLDELVVAKFIETTHAEYEKCVGEHFGDTVIGFFTDEPGFYNNFWDRNPQTVPWTRGFLEYFKTLKGYHLHPYLPLLWLDGESCQKVRYDYYDAFARLYQTAFFKKLYDWCDQRQLLSVGHVNNEELIKDHARYSGHFFRSMRYLHTPGIDLIEGKRAKDSIVPKLVSSASHIFKAQRCMSETYGVFGWKTTLEEMKWTADWQYVRGVNLMVPHAFYYSIEGERRNECPPSEFFQNVWWKYFDKYSDYMRRLSFLLSQGTHIADTAVYYPIASVWANLTPGETPLVDEIDSVFRLVSHQLLCHQLDFDYLDDDAFSEVVRVEDGALKVNDEEFRVLILPHVTAIPVATLEKLEEFHRQGGCVVAVDTNSEIWSALTTSMQKSINFGKTAIPHDDPNLINLILAELKQPDISLSESNTDIKYLHRRIDNLDVYFIVNESPSPTDTVEITFRATGKPEEWNPETGEIHNAPHYTVENGCTIIPITLYGWGSTIIVFDRDAPVSPVGEVEIPVAHEEIPIAGEWTFHLEGSSEKRQIPLQSWTEFGFPHYSGSAVYEKHFELPSDFTSERVILDLGDVRDAAEIWLNGARIGARAWRPYRFDVTEHIRPGGNELTVMVTNTLENEFNRNPISSGLLGPVRLEKTLKRDA